MRYSIRGNIVSPTTPTEVMVQTAVRSASFGGQYLHGVSSVMAMRLLQYLLIRAEKNESSPKDPLSDPKKKHTDSRDQCQSHNSSF